MLTPLNLIFILQISSALSFALYPTLLYFPSVLAVNVGIVHSVCSTEYYCFGFYDLSFCILKGIVLLFDYIKIKEQELMKTILIYCVSELVGHSC